MQSLFVLEGKGSGGYYRIRWPGGFDGDKDVRKGAFSFYSELSVGFLSDQVPHFFIRPTDVQNFPLLSFCPQSLLCNNPIREERETGRDGMILFVGLNSHA